MEAAGAAGKRLAAPHSAQGGRVAGAAQAALAAADKVEEAALGSQVKVAGLAERAKATRVGGNKAAKPADKGAAADKAAEADRVAEEAVSPPAKMASKGANACSSFWEAGTFNP